MFGITSIYRTIQSTRILKISPQCVIQTANYAVPQAKLGVVKKGKKAGQVGTKVKFPVESNVNRLLSHCCGSNIYLEGEDVELKPDSEYPDWLWTLNDDPVPLEEIPKDSKLYYRKCRKAAAAITSKRKKERFY